MADDRKAFTDQVARSLFPEYLGKGSTLTMLAMDHNMPAPINGAKPNSSSFAMIHFMLVMEQLGMGKLEPGVGHLTWSNYDDAYSWRGFVCVIIS